MLIRTKIFTIGKGRCKVELFKDGGFYTVKVNGEIYKKTANELFAVQAFNAI